MEGHESCEHGKYCAVCSCVIAEHIEILVNNENVRLEEFPHYKGDRQFQQEAIDGLSCSPLEAKALTEIVKEVYLEKKDPVQENEMGKEEIRIVTGMKTHLIDEYLKIIDEHKAALPP
jgi:hypothetical protein